MDYSKILNEAYQEFLLDLGDKKVPTPYRINIPFQEDRTKYGKSDAHELTENTIKLAKEKSFDLKSASVEEIRKFMEVNWLGIDCSGLVYHLLDNLLKETGQGSMVENGFLKASSTNVAKLTSAEFSSKIEGWDRTRPGDLIRLNSENADHILIVLKTKGDIVTYAHSSGITAITGVHSGKIIDGQFPEDLLVYRYNKDTGDGIYRLKALQ